MTASFQLNFILLYVDSVPRGEEFYEQLLGRKPVESSPTFAMFSLAEEGAPRGQSMFVGLWQRDDVKPAAQAVAGGSEFAFVVETPDDVERLHDEWRGLGVRIVQPPEKMDFGTTFTATDPDGHRIRVFARAG